MKNVEEQKAKKMRVIGIPKGEEKGNGAEAAGDVSTTTGKHPGPDSRGPTKHKQDQQKEIHNLAHHGKTDQSQIWRKNIKSNEKKVL